MKKSPEASDLRRAAEKQVGQRDQARQPRGKADLTRLLHELEVHQLELEMQNEELRAARLEVEAGLRRYAELFDFAPIGYFTVDEGAVIREVNFAGARLVGRERGRVVGRPFGALVSTRDAGVFERFLAEVLLDGKSNPPSSRSCELVLLREGGAASVRLTAVALKPGGPASAQGNQPFHALALVAAEDVTARRLAEDALREEGRRKDEFLAALSHELRNPLAPIRNGLHLMGRLPAGSEQASRILTVVTRQVNHLVRLVDDLLDVTRIARGKVRLVPETIELGDLVARSLEEHQPTFERAGVDLQASGCAPPCWVDGDPARLAQVLANLLGNAVKFTPRGGRVEVLLQQDDGWAVLRVRDRGLGIASEVLGRLFQPFVQGAQTIDRTGGGLGLGLATVRGLVELHGGTVAAASDGPNRGAEFTVRLPLVAAPAPAARVHEPVRPEARRVLVIEDNLDGAETLRDLLELDGHQVRVAGNGPAGLSLAREFGPEIVVCDLGLPEMDGYQVARELRADAALRSAFLIALSGYAQDGDVERARMSGFDRHLAKPATPEKLEALFSEAFRSGGAVH